MKQFRVLVACEFSGIVRNAFTAMCCDASKSTCLWLKGLPRLVPTKNLSPRIVTDSAGKTWKRWANQTDSGQNRLSPSDSRSDARSKTYPGIAAAMATQWVTYINGLSESEEVEFEMTVPAHQPNFEYADRHLFDGSSGDAANSLATHDCFHGVLQARKPRKNFCGRALHRKGVKFIEPSIERGLL